MWDSTDKINNLRQLQAEIIASKCSGLPTGQVTPSEWDFELADIFSELIDNAIEHGI